VLGYDVSQPWACRTCHHLIAIGRSRDGVTLAQATAEMDTISAALMQAYPKEYSAAGVILTPIREQLLGRASTSLYILLGAVSFVLLVACANLANLLFARSMTRGREMGVRSALGASRGRVVRQLLIENCLLAIDPTQPLSRVTPLDRYVSLSVQGRRFAMIMIGTFAAIALLLSLTGIYGVTAYSVAQRTREIGIRMALGAQRRQVLGRLLPEGLLLIFCGAVLGMAASAGLMRFLASMLFEVKATDPSTFFVVATLLVAVAALACWIPARRSTKIDPMVALRYE
jgi:ABC-type antimicrobial peptide transport system permease subunit